MEVVRLGLPYNSVYTPDALIEGYSSMIWTERYQEAGEFELKTNKVSETLSLLPEMTLISLRDTWEVMMVETRSIGVDSEGRPELTVTGRSLDAFLEMRHVEAPYKKRRKLRKAYSATGASAVLLWNSTVNSSGKDVTRAGDYIWTDKDKIPNVAISDSVANLGSNRRWWVREGPLYSQLMNIMARGDLGLRTIRPNGSSAMIVSIKTALAERGDIVRTWTTDIGALRFDIFDGINRSHTQSTNSEVAFNYHRGDIDQENYLFSIREFRTHCEVMSEVGGSDVTRNANQAAYTGLERRVMSWDGGEPEYPDKPEDPGKNATQAENNQYETDLAAWKNEVAAIKAEFLADNADDALRTLKRARKVSLFTGDITPTAPYEFKTHYNLGDTVSLYGNYNQTEAMVVSEYVRTEDSEGDRGYPGLTLP
jgi:hypothetical protein